MAADAGVLDSTSLRRSSWKDEVDDAALTANEGTEPDVPRLIAVDEESVLRETLEEDQRQAEGVSPRQEVLETLKLLLSGGVAGAVSKTATAPLARLTILYQVKGLPPPFLPHQYVKNSSLGGSSPPMGVAAAFRSVIHREGWWSLWKGNGVTIVHRLPYSAANFYIYETVNELWKTYLPAQGPLAFGDVTRRLVAGGAAGLTACALAYPLDLVRTRLAAQTTENYYRGILHALRTIVRDEGARGLYRGLSATLFQVGPSLAINYAAYETARSSWLAISDRTTPTLGMSLTCGSLAGLVSSTLTFPLDLVRRRLQLQGRQGVSAPNISYARAFASIARSEGLAGMYSGIVPEYYKVIPGVAIAFCTYEIMKRAMNVQTNAVDR